MGALLIPLAIQLAPVLIGALAPMVAGRFGPKQDAPDRMVTWLVGSGMAGATAMVTGGDPTLALVGGATVAEIVDRMKGAKA